MVAWTGRLADGGGAQGGGGVDHPTEVQQKRRQTEIWVCWCVIVAFEHFVLLVFR